ncbi:s1 RNA binding domain-containing protein [Cyclospora cayetanensis]|uniref:S1 RNA binding domain-containing protein n=1 Tax=Cyclospora cayetanensis TaxID=88456 RepID=A0A1D3CV64_9EIME|nr:s1 RNA binding domain-containing protein [Cyclospora cayetanensis]
MLGDSLEGDAFDPRYDRSPSPQKQKKITSGVGTIIKGVVKNIRPFGAFIQTSDYARECLLHISNINKHRVENVEDHLKMGQEVWVKVIREEPDGRVAVSMKEVNQDDGSEIANAFSSFNQHRGTGGGVRIPELHSIHHGTVKKIQPFGAFVALDGFDRDGLLHISAISKNMIDKVEDVLSVGDKVWVKVTKVDEGGRYSLDMRDISQSDGTDKDPNNLQKTKTHRPTSLRQEAIVLQAVVNATKGHMTHECFNKAGKKYEMIEEEEGSAMAALCASSSSSSTPASSFPFPSFSSFPSSLPVAATGANMIPLKQPMPPLNPLDPLNPRRHLHKGRETEKGVEEIADTCCKADRRNRSVFIASTGTAAATPCSFSD